MPVIVHCPMWPKPHRCFKANPKIQTKAIIARQDNVIHALLHLPKKKALLPIATHQEGDSHLIKSARGKRRALSRAGHSIAMILKASRNFPVLRPKQQTNRDPSLEGPNTVEDRTMPLRRTTERANKEPLCTMAGYVVARELALGFARTLLPSRRP